MTLHQIPYDAGFSFKVWATGQWKIGECFTVFQFSVYMLSLSFLVSVLSFSNQKPCVRNPMSMLYISPMTDKKTAHHMVVSMNNRRQYTVALLAGTLQRYPRVLGNPPISEVLKDPFAANGSFWDARCMAWRHVIWSRVFLSE